MMGATPCPPFEEASRRFQKFLLDNAWPTEIVWVKTEAHLASLPADEVIRHFEFARHQGLGVCLCAIRVTENSTVAVIEYPRDSDEAERLMYPSDGGLKLSVVLTDRTG